MKSVCIGTEEGLSSENDENESKDGRMAGFLKKAKKYSQLL